MEPLSIFTSEFISLETLFKCDATFKQVYDPYEIEKKVDTGMR